MPPDPARVLPAATLILFRPSADGPPEILMLERAQTMAFAPGALVFPGGRVDPDDRVLGKTEQGAAIVAAIRETIEEAGIAVGLSPPPDAAAVRRLRGGLAGGASFSELLVAEGLAVIPDALVPYARWRPNFPHVRTFDTAFFLAEVPPGTEAVVDGTECVSAVWAGAAAMLASGRQIIFPTRRNLERIATCAGFADAVADSRRYPVRLIEPRIVTRDDGDWMTIPDGHGYPVLEETMKTVKRG